MLTVVHLQQVFGTDNDYIQDDGRGHEIIFVALWPVNSSENTDVAVPGRNRTYSITCFDHTTTFKVL